MLDSPPTRHSLILRLPASTDTEAWQEFAAIYEPLIYRFGRRRGMQDADARELVQNVFVAVTRAVSRWQPDPARGRFRAWLFRIARNQLIDMVGKRKVDRGTGKTSVMLALQQVHELPQDRELLLDYRRELFLSAAGFIRDSVQPTTWQAFWSTSVEGEPIDSAAQRLGISVGAIYIARSRVLHRLKQLIHQWEVEDEQHS